MGGKSGGGGGDRTVTQRTEIPAFLRPFVERQARIGTDALGRLEGQLSGAGAEELVAGFDPLQEQAFNLAVQRAQGAGGFIPTAQQEILATAQGRSLDDIIGGTALDTLRGAAGGDFLFGGEGFDQAVEASLRRAQPAILSAFGGSGRGTGGLAQAAIAQQATDAFASQFGQERQRQLAASGILADLSQTERGRQLAAASALPEIALADAGILQNVGGIRQGQAQRELLAPISAQETLLAAAGGGIPLQSLLGSTSTQSTDQGGSNLLANIVGGGLTGLSLASGFGAPLALGLGGGALAGGLLS